MTETYESLEEHVYSSVRYDILSGMLSPGARLSIEELASKYGVSRTPVRQALNALSHGGFVETIPRVGYFVSTLTIKDIKDMFGLRRILESATAELAAEKISEAQLARLEELNTAFVHGDVDSYVAYLRNHREFHHIIAVATGNMWLAEAVGDLLDHMQRLFIIRLNTRVHPPEEIVREHREIIEALRSRDRELAKSVLVGWMDKSEKDILDAILQGQSHLRLSL